MLKFLTKIKNKATPPLYFNPSMSFNIMSGKMLVLTNPEIEMGDQDTFLKEENDAILRSKERIENVKAKFWISKGAARIQLEDLGTAIFQVGDKVIFKDSSIYNIETSQKEINYNSMEIMIGEIDSKSSAVYVMDLGMFYQATQQYHKNKGKSLEDILNNLNQKYYIINVASGYYEFEVLNKERKSVRDYYGLLKMSYSNK